MKKLLLTVTFLLAASSLGWAGACGTDSLANYEAAGFSCSVGSLLFSGFSYNSSAVGAATAPTAAQVTVAPFYLGGEFGLEFTAGWVSGLGGSDNAVINLTVSCPGCTIIDAALIMGGGAIGTGTAAVTETGPNLATSAPGNLSAHTNLFATSLTPTVTINTTGGNGNGHISGVFVLYSVPEPASLALLGTALIGAGLVLRRRLTQ